MVPASPRLISTEYPRCSRGAAAIRLHEMSTSRPRASAATRLRGTSASRPRRRRDPPSQDAGRVAFSLTSTLENESCPRRARWTRRSSSSTSSKPKAARLPRSFARRSDLRSSFLPVAGTDRSARPANHPRRRRGVAATPSPRNVHVAAAACRLLRISSPRPRPRAPARETIHGGVAATRFGLPRGCSAFSPRSHVI